MNGVLTPALLNSTSSRPNFSCVASNNARTCAGFVTSASTHQRLRIAAGLARTASSASRWRPASTTRNPSRRNASAVALPMPLPAPVISATRFSVHDRSDFSALTIAAPHQELAERARFVHAQLHFDGLTANLTVFDINTRTGADVGASLEGFAAIGAVDARRTPPRRTCPLQESLRRSRARARRARPLRRRSAVFLEAHAFDVQFATDDGTTRAARRHRASRPRARSTAAVPTATGCITESRPRQRQRPQFQHHADPARCPPAPRRISFAFGELITFELDGPQPHRSVA